MECVQTGGRRWGANPPGVKEVHKFKGKQVIGPRAAPLAQPQAWAVKLDFVNRCFKAASRGWLPAISKAAGLPGSGRLFPPSRAQCHVTWS